MSTGTLESEVLMRLPQLAEFRFQLRKFLNFSETESERFGVAPQQYQLMQVVGAMPDGDSASISYLAERMVLRHNSTVELVDRAERAGLVQRTSDERDLRRSIVVLTGEGRSILERMICSHLEQIDGQAGEQLLRALADLREAGDRGEPESLSERSL
jgi:DNA-binding MarR family transcriptional regulator